ncbi:MAG: glycosyltransferase family 4 protein [Chloroflexi bacterium]|nr:glycosyltransferase family 4 protein [Chloroflexota bacterium]
MKNFRLLFHHHVVAYQRDSKTICVPSYIGRWINALVDHLGEIGLLLYESEMILPEQDEIIQAENVTLWSLGPPGKTWDRIPRIKRLQKVCAQAVQETDGLLVRGWTPRQMNVWKATPLKKKAFMLVGSLLETRLSLQPSFWRIYEILMLRWRQHEVLQITKQGVVLANSPHLANELGQLHRKATFVPTNSIRLEDITPLEVRELSNPRKILFCSRVIQEKGIIELIHALAKFNTIQPSILDIVGPVEPTFRLTLDKLIFELGISDSVNWHGRIPFGDALFDYFRQADVFVLPSYFEGFPHVIWEAAANCCPVVTTFVGGIPALWKDARHGLLIPPKDASAIVEALNKLFGDDNLRSRLIRSAHVYAKEFTVNECAVRLVNTLEEYGWGN